MVRPYLFAELRSRIDRGIDVASDAHLGLGQGVRHVGERDVTNDENVHVAFVAKLPAGGRSEDECDLDLVKERRQALPYDVHESRRLSEDCLQFREDRTLGVCLEIDVASFHAPPQQARIDQ